MQCGGLDITEKLPVGACGAISVALSPRETLADGVIIRRAKEKDIGGCSAHTAGTMMLPVTVEKQRCVRSETVQIVQRASAHGGG